MMTTLIENIAAAILLILIILLILHTLNGTAGEWIISKVKAEQA